jgi:hypothetical protein
MLVLERVQLAVGVTRQGCDDAVRSLASALTADMNIVMAESESARNVPLSEIAAAPFVQWARWRHFQQMIDGILDAHGGQVSSPASRDEADEHQAASPKPQGDDRKHP